MAAATAVMALSIRYNAAQDAPPQRREGGSAGPMQFGPLLRRCPAVFALLAFLPALAQDKTASMLVGAAPGGGTDAVAFAKMMQDPQFLQQAKKIEPDIIAMSGEDVLGLMQLLADTPPEALAYMVGLQKKQGLHVAE